MMFQLHKSVNQQISLPSHYGVELFLKREDQIHLFISGNKYRKLKYNIEEAQKRGYKKLLTFGGAYSNHIAAVAFAGNMFGFETLGIIRGDELKDKVDDNATLSFAKKHGMQFKFMTREAYRTDKLIEKYQDYYIIPEGGTNALAIKGCEEILTETDVDFNYVCTSVGTGGTMSGLINCSQPSQQVLGFPALKGSFLQEDISKFVSKHNWELVTNYHFGGYAKINLELIRFINEFKKKQHIPLDPVYTGKMMFGIFDLIQKDYFPKGSRILAIHTGGLQGIEGMNNLLKQKNLPLIE
ncbi:1-aminocyclopropane-1-carboxylate deaminase/D-cysteine desulfhydrase [Confluentibacter flavum]|uniref:1-aminocyclopropane-1-carboxylate deaminase n=1 Tax=Confluentibacter flavum TaxID=1909700 RepID=A0A2N3HJU3_9FLAO|nr:pyridoxal-phosphate dependent enzyme [Confluentibacter flavum]PKQ45211.1 1-aminocyclopropane-1-carboxylate deaminase [Confluentibacter flavum]